MDKAQGSNLGDEEMTAEETAAFDSMMRGEEVSSSEPSPAPAEVPPAAELKPEQQQAPAEPKAEDDDAEGVTIDDTGRAHNAKGKYVPHAALHKEREGHKQTKAELARLSTENTRYSERMALLIEAFGGNKQAQQPAPAPEPTEIPDFTPVNPEEDPLGAVKQVQEMLARVAPTAKRAAQTTADMQAHQAEVQTAQRYMNDLNAYATKDPTFREAMQHVMTTQKALLEAQGVTDPEAQRQQLFQLERNFVQQTYKAGANPAERLVTMARAFGWKAPATPAPQNGAPAQSQVASKIDNINRGMKASASLSNVSSAGGDGLPTIQQVMALDEEDYASFVSKLGGTKAFERRYLGRE